VALCGATVTNVTTRAYRPTTPGACPTCTAQIVRVVTLIEMRGHDFTEFDL
jgi:hypothetical protein